MNKIKNIILSFIVLIILYVIFIISYNFVEPKFYDFMIKNIVTLKLPTDTKKQVFGSDDIVLVVIDNKTVDKYRWPWKREMHSKIYDYFSKYANPRALVHDVIVTSLDTDNPQSDKIFFNSIKNYDNLISGFLFDNIPYESKTIGEEYDKKFENKFSLDIQNFPQNNTFQSTAIMPNAYFNALNNTGFVNTFIGFLNNNHFFNFDDVHRNQAYILSYHNKAYPSLAFKTFLHIYKNPKIIYENNRIKFPELKYNLPEGTLYPRKFYKLKPNDNYTHIKYSACDIIESINNIENGKKPIINPDEFKDKIVIYGAYATAADSLNDAIATPIHPNHPGVDVQATSIENILYNDFLKVIPYSINLLIAFLGMILIYLSIRLNNSTKGLLYTFSIIIVYLSTCFICFYNSIVIYTITPIIMFIISMLIASIHKFIIETHNKEKVKNAMGKYMSEDVMKNVLKNIDNLGLGGKKANITVLFSDIRGFTSLSEKMTAQEVSEILNEYFSEMEPIITKYNGIINKFIGDAIMAIFGEPIEDENHARNAVLCAIEMQEKVEKLREKWANENKPQIHIGVGVNTGEVFVGNIGSKNRMEYTVIGDTVNLASRLENYNKTYKTEILISSSTFSTSKDIIIYKEIPDIEIRGKAEKQTIYEVIKKNN